MTNLAKKKAKLFLKKHSIKTVSYASLCEVAEKSGYTVIEFQCSDNDEDVSVVINELGLQNAVLCSKGFTYADSNYRLIFINEALSESEKCLVISHEIGHIECGHITEKNVFGNDVRQEHEANEFSHYLLKRKNENISFFRKNKVLIAVSVAIIVVASAIVIWCVNSSSDVGSDVGRDEYYITVTGHKYHKADCKYIKNKPEVITITKESETFEKYDPCMVCLSDEVK